MLFRSDQFGHFHGIGSINTFVPQENRKSFKPEGTIIGSLQEAICAIVARKLIPAPPRTLGSTAAAQARIVVWCRDCRHQAEPDPAELARRYGGDTPIPEWQYRRQIPDVRRRSNTIISARSPEPRATGAVNILSHINQYLGKLAIRKQPNRGRRRCLYSRQTR